MICYKLQIAENRLIVHRKCSIYQKLRVVKGKGKVAHLYSATGSTWPSYLQNTLHYLPDRATASKLDVKIPGSHLHTHTGWSFDLSTL